MPGHIEVGSPSWETILKQCSTYKNFWELKPGAHDDGFKQKKVFDWDRYRSRGERIIGLFDT